MVDSNIGETRRQLLATGAGTLLGSLIGESLSARRPSAGPCNTLKPHD